jgi:hypothetical protein
MTRFSFCSIATVVVALGCVAPSLHGQTVCPGDHPDSRELVSRFLTRTGFGPDRAALGLAGVTAETVRVLNDSQDASACRTLADAVDAAGAGDNWRWTGYQVGNYYFVSWRRSETATTRWIGFVPLYIFDTSFHQVRGLTM